MASGQPALSEQRRFVTPEPEETLDALTARVLPGDPDGLDKTKSWNLHLFLRNPPGLLLGSDIVFVEPPRA